jgi:hypothetical protein
MLPDLCGFVETGAETDSLKDFSGDYFVFFCFLFDFLFLTLLYYLFVIEWKSLIDAAKRG